MPGAPTQGCGEGATTVVLPTTLPTLAVTVTSALQLKEAVAVKVLPAPVGVMTRVEVESARAWGLELVRVTTVFVVNGTEVPAKLRPTEPVTVCPALSDVGSCGIAEISVKGCAGRGVVLVNTA